MLHTIRIFVFVLLLLSILVLARSYTTSIAKANDRDVGSINNIGKNPIAPQVPSPPPGLGDFVLDVSLFYNGNANWSPNRMTAKKARLSGVALMSSGARWIRAKAYNMKWRQTEKDWILNNYANNTKRVEVIFHAFRQDTNFCIGVSTSSAPDWLQSNLPGAVLFLKSYCEPRVAVANPAGIDVTFKYDFSAWFRDDSPRELGEIPLAFGWQTLNHTDAAPDDNVRKFCFGADEGRSWGPNVLDAGTCRYGAPVLLNNSQYYLGTVTEGFTGQDHYLPDNEVGNDSVRSLKVNQGWSVTLYEHSNYAGVSETFSNWDNDLFNNAIGYSASSVRTNTNGVVVYRDNNFGGVYEVFNDVPCDTDLSNNTIGNNTITSVRVPPGWRVTLFDDVGCLGSKHVLQGVDDPFVSGGGFNDRASSIKVQNPQSQESAGEVGDWVPD